jgi:carbonic anhydrase
MVNLAQRKQLFISGMVKNAGWNYMQAEQHFDTYSKQFEIENEIDFTVQESIRLQATYPKVTVVPLLFKVEDSKLYQIVQH